MAARLAPLLLAPALLLWVSLPASALAAPPVGEAPPLLETVQEVVAGLGGQDVAAAGVPACVAAAGVACSFMCIDGQDISVTVVGLGSGSASCGGVTASCSTSTTCTDSATVPRPGLIDVHTGSCTASGVAVVVCQG